MKKIFRIIVPIASAAVLAYIVFDWISSSRNPEKSPESSAWTETPEMIKKDQKLIRALIEGRNPIKTKWKGLSHAIRTVGHRAAITGLLFLEGGKKLVSSSWDKTVKIWDVSDPSHPDLIHTYNKFNSNAWELMPFLAMAKSSNARLFGLIIPLGGVYDNRKALEIIDLETGFSNSLAGGYCTSLAFAIDGRLVAAGMIDGSVRIQRIKYLVSGQMEADNKSAFKLRDHARFVTSVAFAKDRFASASEDRTIRLYKYDDSKFVWLKTLEHEDKVTALAFSPDSRFLLTATGDNKIIVYDKDGDFEKEFARLEASPHSLGFSPDGKIVYTSCTSGACLLFSFPEGERITTFKEHRSPITALACTRNSDKILVASGDQRYGEILLWDDQGQIISVIEGFPGQVSALGITDDCQIGFALGSDEMINQAIDLKTLDSFPAIDDEKFQKRKVSAGNFRIEKPEPSPDMEPVMRVDALDVVSPSSRARILRTALDGSEHTCYTFIGDDYLAIGGRNGSLSVYTRDGFKILNLIGHEGDILDLAYNQTGKWLVSSSSDGTVMLWSLMNFETRRNWNLRDGDWYRLEDIYFEKGVQAIKDKLSAMSYEDINKKALVAYLVALAGGSPSMKPMITFLFDKDGHWLLWNNRDLFSSKTEDLWGNVGYYVFSERDEDNPEFLPCSQIYDCFFKPSAIQRLVDTWISNPNYRNTNENALNFIKDSRAFEELPPRPQIISPEDGETVETDGIDVDVNIENAYGMIGDVLLYHNGKLVSSESVYEIDRDGVLGLFKMFMVDPRIPISYEKFKPSHSPVRKYFKVNLIPGENILASQAKNGSNTLSSGMTKIHVQCNVPNRSPKLYVLVNGMKNFKNKRMNLQTPHNDARKMGDVLSKQRESRFAGYEVIKHLDPGKQKIMESVFHLKDIIRPEDTFIFYASTHGQAIKSPSKKDHYEYYLVTSDFADDVTEDVTLSTRELLEISKLIPALNQIYILDTCNAGASYQEFTKIYNEKLMIFGMGAGMHIMAASSPTGAALDDFFGNGLFTYYLLQALRGAADANNDHKVTTKEAAEYVRKKCQEVARADQKPEIFSYGPDLPITIW